MARSKVGMFILEPGKALYTEAKGHGSLNVSCFLLETMEKLLDGQNRYGALNRYPLHRDQHASQTCKCILKPHLMT
jgi:hypothetical protein